MVEKRIISRKKVLKAGTIAFGGAAINCTVRNLSATGAMLDVESPLGIPRQFMLDIAADHFRRECQVAGFRKGGSGSFSWSAPIRKADVFRRIVGRSDVEIRRWADVLPRRGRCSSQSLRHRTGRMVQPVDRANEPFSGGCSSCAQRRAESMWRRNDESPDWISTVLTGL